MKQVCWHLKKAMKLITMKLITVEGGMTFLPASYGTIMFLQDPRSHHLGLGEMSLPGTYTYYFMYL